MQRKISKEVKYAMGSSSPSDSSIKKIMSQTESVVQSRQIVDKIQAEYTTGTVKLALKLTKSVDVSVD